MNRLAALIESHEDWLMDRILHYAVVYGYAAYTSTLAESWRMSICGLSTPMISVLRDGGMDLELHLEKQYDQDVVTSFGITEGMLHRRRGIDIGMFLGLMKYYRQTYIDLVEMADLTVEEESNGRYFINRFFDRVEIGLCTEWISGSDSEHIRELQATNRTMTNEKNKYLTIFESLGSPVVLLGVDGRIENVNQAGATLFNITDNRYYLVNAAGAASDTRSGQASKQFIGRLGDEVLPWLASDLSAFVCSEEPFWQAERGVRAAEEVLYFEVRLTRMLDVSQKNNGVLIILNDVTAQRQMTEQLHEARRVAEIANQAKSDFLANMSHELRTPLNAILGFSQVLEKSGNLQVEQVDNLRVIRRSGEHLLSLINQILDLSKIESGKMGLQERPFNLLQLLDDILDIFRLRVQEKELNLCYERADAVPHLVVGDQMKLRQVLLNLIGNAVKFTEQGWVSLTVLPGEKRPYTAVNPQNLPVNFVRFEIADSGPGISAEELETIFEPFVQSQSGRDSQEGTGLGMTISQRFVELLGGKIVVDSRVGEGATFSFEIPLKVATMLEQETADNQRQVIGLAENQPDFRIMVVDDKPFNRMLIVKLLSPLGFAVKEAANGAEAIALWQQWEPHLILMDMRMPVLNGYEATRQIKLSIKGQATAILAMTASVLLDERAVVLSAGCDGFIQKPFHQNELFSALEYHLGVRFVYAPQKERKEGGGKRPLPDIAAVQLLPADWIAAFQQAVEALNADKARQLLSQLPQTQALLAEQLLALVNSYRFDTLQQVMEQTHEKRGKE